MYNNISFALGNQRYAKISKWKWDKLVEFRWWGDNRPTKRGFSLPLMQWKQLVDSSEYIDEALKNGKAYQSHLGTSVLKTRGGTCSQRGFTAPTSPLFQMWIKT